MAKILKQKFTQSSSDTNSNLASDTKESADQTTTPYLDQEGVVVGPNGEPVEEKDPGPLYDEQEEQESADNGGHNLPDED